MVAQFCCSKIMILCFIYLPVGLDAARCTVDHGDTTVLLHVNPES